MKGYSNALKLKFSLGAISTASMGVVCLLAIIGFKALLLFASTIYAISNQTFSRLDWFRNDAAIPFGIFLGALLVLLLVGCAVRVLIGSWSKRIWATSLVFSFTMVCVGELFGRSPFNGFLLLILLSSAIIGVLIGHWIGPALEAAAKAQPTMRWLR